ncbi:MAG: hypothetical protein ACFFG0_49690, partial [Candidatus Thorarchaeota archaeon]
MNKLVEKEKQIDYSYKYKKWLYEQYITLNRYRKEIAKECGVSVDNINYFLKKFNINKRKNKKYLNKKWLYEQYITLNKGVPQIAYEQKTKVNNIYSSLNKFKIRKNSTSIEFEIPKDYRINYMYSNKYLRSNKYLKSNLKKSMIQYFIKKYCVIEEGFYIS